MTTDTSRTPKRRGKPVEEQQRRTRKRGTERTALSTKLKALYDSGESIRALCMRHDLSYGLTHTLLVEAGTKLRTRHGGRRKGGEL